MFQWRQAVTVGSPVRNIFKLHINIAYMHHLFYIIVIIIIVIFFGHFK